MSRLTRGVLHATPTINMWMCMCWQNYMFLNQKHLLNIWCVRKCALKLQCKVFATLGLLFYLLFCSRNLHFRFRQQLCYVNITIKCFKLIMTSKFCCCFYVSSRNLLSFEQFYYFYSMKEGFYLLFGNRYDLFFFTRLSTAKAGL